MAKKRRSAKAIRHAARAVSRVRDNPETTMELVSAIAPGAGTFLLTTVINSRIEALIGGQGLGKPLPSHCAPPIQKISSVVVPAALLGLTYWATSGPRLRPYRVSAMAGVGAALLVRVIGHVLAMTKTPTIAVVSQGGIPDYDASTTWSTEVPQVSDEMHDADLDDDVGLGIFE